MIFRRPKAVDAIIEQAEYIGQDSPDAAERFIKAAERTFFDLEKMPGMGHLLQSSNSLLEEIRVWPVKGFRNHLIFYRLIPGGIDVITLLHGARDINAVLLREL